MRKIIHIDMDAFYASVEQRDNPDLKGLPIAVGGSRTRGVVAAASYEARKFGVRSALSSKLAYLKCPDLIFVKPRFEVYKSVSIVIKSIFREYTDLIEPLSLDEAYLDVTKAKKGPPSATLIAQEIRKRILDQTALTASAGISFNKFLAKTASDVNKPNGYFVITPEEAPAFISALPIEDFHGIGKVTAAKMRKLGIKSGKELKNWKLEHLVRRFGKAGEHYYQIAQGIDERPVVPDRPRKSVGAEQTFETDLKETYGMMEALVSLTQKVWGRVENGKRYGRTLTLKVKFSDFKQITRSHSFEEHVDRFDIFKQGVLDLAETHLEDGMEVRLLGVSMSNFDQDISSQSQLTIAL